MINGGFLDPPHASNWNSDQYLISAFVSWFGRQHSNKNGFSVLVVLPAVIKLRAFKIKYQLSASITSPVRSMSIAIFLGTARPTATAGVEQNRPIFTLF